MNDPSQRGSDTHRLQQEWTWQRSRAPVDKHNVDGKGSRPRVKLVVGKFQRHRTCDIDQFFS
jgi:hypothetical protein